VEEPLGLVLTGGLSPLLARFFSQNPPVDRQLLHHGARCFLLA
jgi:pantothenate kinase type III